MPRSNTPAFTVATNHLNKSNTSYFENHYMISCIVNNREHSNSYSWLIPIITMGEWECRLSLVFQSSVQRCSERCRSVSSWETSSFMEGRAGHFREFSVQDDSDSEYQPASQRVLSSPVLLTNCAFKNSYCKEVGGGGE